MLLRCYRALGFDTRVIRLNRALFHGDDEMSWPSPFTTARYIRPVTLGLRVVTKAFAQRVICRRHTKEEREVAERENARDEALGEYRKTLEKIFNDEERIDDIVLPVGAWTDGE